jgi:hypothetical protein
MRATTPFIRLAIHAACPRARRAEYCERDGKIAAGAP